MEIYLKNKEEIVVRDKTELGERVSKILDYMESENIERLEIQGLVITKVRSWQNEGYSKR